MRISPVHCVAVTSAMDIVSAEVALDHALLVGRNDEIRPVDRARDPESREAHQRRAQVFDAGVLDAQRRPRHRREADERSDLDVVGTDAMRAAAERPASVDREQIRADSLDVRAQRDEKVAKILDVRLAGGVAENRRP